MHPNTERRRSVRVSDSLPLVIRGNDSLGQPFEERTATLNFNLHGCRYSSKHHLPKNTWLTLQRRKTSGHRNVRARVAWIQRPHLVREFFQIAVELESPENIWKLDPAPADWVSDVPPYQSVRDSSPDKDLSAPNETSSSAVPTTLASYMGKLMADMKNSSFDTSSSETNAMESSAGSEFAPPSDSPFLRELRAELDRHAVKAVETAAAKAQEKLTESAREIGQSRAASDENSVEKWNEEFERTQREAREKFDEHLSARQSEFLKGFQTEVEENFARGRSLMVDFDQKLKALHEEGEAARETIRRIEQSRVQMEGTEAARLSKASAEESIAQSRAAEHELGAWRDRLQSEMNLAQAQWNELLQSSLDSSLQRLVEQLSERSLEVQQSAEHKITERYSELTKPLAQAVSAASETLSEIRTSIEQQIGSGRASLKKPQRSAARIRENSAQFDAASHDSLNELHRRLENMLDAQTAEMARRIDALASGMSERISPAIESIGNQQVERAAAQMESKLAPHLERVPALLRELAAREVQVDEGLRLHRERLRQASENNQRDVDSRMVFTLAELHRNFEAARTQALTKWNEELDASGVRVSHSATESLSRASEWFQQEARSRLQVLVEQALAGANSGMETTAAEATRKFEAHLTERAGERVLQITQNLEGIGSEVAERTRGGLEAAALASAASFGEVLRGISDQEIDFLSQRSRAALQQRTAEFEQSSKEHLQKLQTDAHSSMEQFHSQMDSQIENRIAQGRNALAEEFGAAMEGHRAERDVHEQQWIAKLGEWSGEAEGKFQERLENASDSWSVSSVRRLNEHGQNVIESLMRSADQALRDSFAKVFEGLSELLRQRAPGNAAGVPGFPPGPRESNDATKH